MTLPEPSCIIVSCSWHERSARAVVVRAVVSGHYKHCVFLCVFFKSRKFKFLPQFLVPLYVFFQELHCFYKNKNDYSRISSVRPYDGLQRDRKTLLFKLSFNHCIIHSFICSIIQFVHQLICLLNFSLDKFNHFQLRKQLKNLEIHELKD